MSIRERLRAVAAAVFTPLVLRVFPLPRALTLVDRASAVGGEHYRAHALAHRVRRWLRYGRGPWKETCLNRSVILYTMLRQHGYHPRLHIGVSGTDQRFTAHAWVSLDGQPLGDTPMHLAAFRELWSHESTIIARVPGRRRRMAVRALSGVASAILIAVLGCADSTGPRSGGRLSISPDSVGAFVGDTLHLAPRFLNAGGGEAPAQSLDWSSLDPALATVDSTGEIIVLATGRARIRGAVGALADTVVVLAARVPNFVFVADSEGAADIFRYRNDTIVRLTANTIADEEPNTAAGMLVFTSYRAGNAEVYLSDLDGTAPRRLTTGGAYDGQAALDPTATKIAFVSTRSGTPRIWIMDTLGTGLDSLRAGSPNTVPEGAPAWSPTGDRIAFVSARDGTSQVYVVAATGGTPVRLTSDAGGAFDPSWSGRGDEIVYVSVAGSSRLRSVIGTTSGWTSADDLAVGEPSCLPQGCVAVVNPYADAGDIVAIPAGGGAARALVIRAGNDRQPAVIR